MYVEEAIHPKALATPKTLVTKEGRRYQYTRRSYLRFDLTDISYVRSAKLRLHVLRTGNTAGEHGVIAIVEDDWSENDLIWEGRNSLTEELEVARFYSRAGPGH